MFSGLPKLFGRGFVIGFLLPSSLFCLYIQYLSFDAPDLSKIKDSLADLKIAPVVMLVILLSVLLMALNRLLIRFLEGYGSFNPFRIIMLFRRRYYRWRIKPVFEEYERLKKEREVTPDAVSNVENFDKDLLRFTPSYPYREEWLLPTSFGNTMRSFEVYSTAVYGLDSIPAWPRISFSLSKEAKEQVQDGRSIIDFSANMLVLSIVAISAYLIRNYDHIKDLQSNLALIWPVIGAFYGWFNLPRAARQWGEIVKSAIDVSRFRLAKDLGLEVPKTANEERKMWDYVSKMLVFQSDAAYKALDQFRKKDKPKRVRPDPAAHR